VVARPPGAEVGVTADETTLRIALTRLFTGDAREALASIGASVIDPASLREYWARLRFACPAYLPFATYDGSMLAIHLWPERAVEHSPIYYLPHDDQSATFLCATLADLPVGMWLWVARYFKDDPHVLQAALNRVAAAIPDAREVPARLWTILATAPAWEPTRWHTDSTPETREAWQVGAVRHPFADVPRFVELQDPAEVVAVLRPYVTQHPDAAPEIVAALVAAQREGQQPQSAELVLRVLSAEAERGGTTVFTGDWRVTGDGLAEWDSTLRALDDPARTLTRTPFESLAPDTYARAGGAARLVEVALGLRARGDAAGELRQLRNAAWVEALTEGEVSTTLCAALAESADRVAPGSLAAAVARACAATLTSAA
jgi:hypothetical protein